jgi:hypothetical protein
MTLKPTNYGLESSLHFHLGTSFDAEIYEQPSATAQLVTSTTDRRDTDISPQQRSYAGSRRH